MKTELLMVIRDYVSTGVGGSGTLHIPATIVNDLGAFQFRGGGRLWLDSRL